MKRSPADAQSLESEIARLRDLDLAGLQARWRSVTGRSASPQLPKHLLFRMLAYRLQAVAFGDLDEATVRYLDKLVDELAKGKKMERYYMVSAGYALAHSIINRCYYESTNYRRWNRRAYHSRGMSALQY